MFFIVGSARSGTTLLRLMLNAHREVAIPPETRFIVELWSGTDDVEVAPFFARLSKHHQYRALDLPVDEVRALLPDSPVQPYRDVVESVYRAYAKRRNKKRWGDKTPRYVLYMPLLARLFAESRFIHLIRDGRNVALSYGDVPFGPKTVTRAAKLWATRVEAGIASGRELSGRYLQVRYEDLVSEPEARLRDICGFLEVGFDTGMLEYGTRSIQEVLPRARHYNPRVAEGLIEEARSWERTMPRAQVELFEAVAGELLSELGYPRRFPHTSSRARIAASLGLPLGRLRPTRAS